MAAKAKKVAVKKAKKPKKALPREKAADKAPAPSGPAPVSDLLQVVKDGSALVLFSRGQRLGRLSEAGWEPAGDQVALPTTSWGAETLPTTSYAAETFPGDKYVEDGFVVDGFVGDIYDEWAAAAESLPTTSWSDE